MKMQYKATTPAVYDMKPKQYTSEQKKIAQKTWVYRNHFWATEKFVLN
ncbi:hypothetical protein [Alysiella crassa]|nr:hypothetical protein [Alysiella crassa]UOP08305.1 hypothetical protein LVJ80_09270 [Alysiella crassa]